MKTQALSSGLRVTLTSTELRALLSLARYGADQLAGDYRYHLATREEAVATEVIHGLELGLASVRSKQAEARAAREAPKREAERRAAREYHAEIDGFTVWGIFGDWVDVSDDPDRRSWADMFHPDTKPRDQGEIRRNSWRIFITKGSVTSDHYAILPGGCTMTSDRNEVELLARRIIASASEAGALHPG